MTCHLRELLTAVIRKGRVRVLGRVRTAPRGHDCADAEVSEDAEVNSKSLQNIRNYNVCLQNWLPKNNHVNEKHKE